MSHQYRVLVVGGYGFFGSRLVERLSLQANLDIVIAGRNKLSSETLRARLQPQAQANLQSAVVDAQGESLDHALTKWAPDVLVHTSGPFQGQNYAVAKACIRQGVHYVDLADGSGFVEGISTLNADAVRARVLVTSGASSVPALSAAAADHLALGMMHVHAIDIGISPGNRTERGLSTIQSILTYCGEALKNADGSQSIGWGHSWRQAYSAPVGSRLLSPCDVPDLCLLPSRYEGKPTVRFGAGLELGFLHRGMNLMAAIKQAGLLRDWSMHAKLLKRASDLFKNWGSDAGAMHVRLSGRDGQGIDVTRTWELIATNGHGPFVPTLAAAAIVRKLASRSLLLTGATPCIGLLSLADFAAEAAGLSIRTTTSA